MTNIIKIETTTSLEIARVTGKQHKNVLRDIRERASGEFFEERE